VIIINLKNIMWDEISQKISESIGAPFQLAKQHSIGGGCINSAYGLSDGKRQFFVKTNDGARIGMFQAESEGLKVIAQSDSLRVPQPVCVGVSLDQAYIVMEYISLNSLPANSNSQIQLGHGLAKMHRTFQPHYGWVMDNTIGSTPQINGQNENWVWFWRNQRLGYQLELAATNGYRGRLQQRGDQLMANLDGLFADYTPVASLLHGDLWSGNYAFDASGTPVIFDPAVYFGDRETDLAMTELFSGFSADFYAAYNEHYALHPGYTIRKTLYNLYHILNHLNLFGGGYLTQAENMIDHLISEVG